MSKAKIMEVFRSIQGEGKYAGVAQVFVRFFECNMHCVWCDTPNSIGDTVRRYDEVALDELWLTVRGLWDRCHSVSLTGGEPLLQAEFIRAFLPRMKAAGMPSYLETNGVLPRALAAVIEDIDIVAMDLKLPSSTQCRPYWDEHKDFLKIARRKEVFVKAVISSVTEKEDVLRSAELVSGIDPEIEYILQPNYFDRQNGVVGKCLEFQKACARVLKNVRVMPQMHKFMKLQ